VCGGFKYIHCLFFLLLLLPYLYLFSSSVVVIIYIIKYIIQFLTALPRLKTKNEKEKKKLLFPLCYSYVTVEVDIF
jgi:hypothetical protein